MKVIIDAYRGGNDTGKEINNQLEKDINLDISKYMSNLFTKKGINNELVRTNDINLSDDERNSIINEIKNDNDLIVQNRISEDNTFDIIYPLRNTDSLASKISNDLEKNEINVDKYYQRRLPTETILDYYSIIRNTKPNQTLIIEYKDPNNYKNIVKIIVDTISNELINTNTYTVKKGDSLYQIAKKYNTTVDNLIKTNNLKNNNLSIGQKLIISEDTSNKISLSSNTYTVKKGDSLYQIAKKYNVTVNEIKKLNNLSNNILNIGQELKIPSTQEEYIIYTVKKGDSLYQIAKKYNVTVNEIKKLNNLSNNILNIGQELKILR